MSTHTLWHPLRCADSHQELMAFQHGEGIYVYDTNGKKYIDGESGLWNVSLGYKNEGIIDAITNQLNQIPFVNSCEFSNEASSDLADALVRLHHDEIEKIIYTCTGSESNELAIKLMRKYQVNQFHPERNQIAVIQNSYHGSYYGAMSASHYEGIHRVGYGPLLEGFVELTMPFCRCCRSDQISVECTDKMIKQLEAELSQIGDKLAGIMIEPVLGSGGVIPLPLEYVQFLYRFCQEHDILLTCDEVATGFGRTGVMFQYQRMNIKPDIICMSKGINSGYLPMGAVAVSRKVVYAFTQQQDLIFHLSTQNGNPVCCAAAMATIDQLTDNQMQLIEHVSKMGKYLKEKLHEQFINEDCVFDIRGNGLMLAIDLVSPVSQLPMDETQLMNLVKSLKRKGLIVGWNYSKDITSCIVMFLPFIISQEETDKVISILKKVI